MDLIAGGEHVNDDIMKRIDELERRVTALENRPVKAKSASPGPKATSLREFIISKSPEMATDKALLIGYYLEKEQGITPFNNDDLVKGFNQAREPLPGNLSETLSKVARRGFITESQQKKDGTRGWLVTNSGERYVENGLKNPEA